MTQVAIKTCDDCGRVWSGYPSEPNECPSCGSVNIEVSVTGPEPTTGAKQCFSQKP